MSRSGHPRRTGDARQSGRPWWSRRAVLGATGGVLAGLAGCADLDVDGLGDDDPEYDTERLAALGEEGVPTPPGTFPVQVSEAMVERHRERARDLVDRVPADPDVPNGAVVEQLRHDRDEVVATLDGDADHSVDDPVDEPLERLDEARDVRAEAAAVEAAYRAATGAVERDAVADRRERLRTDLLAFERDWTYRGDKPATALVAHRELEALRREVRRGTAPRRAFPDESVAAPFRIGEIVRQLEDGRAALADAERLRASYREGLSDPRPYRAAFSAATRRLEDRRRTSHHERRAPVDPDRPPFDRSIEGTAAGRLYREAAVAVRRHGEAVRRARRRGEGADALVEAGMAFASIRALDAVVTDIAADRVGEPSDAGRIAAVRGEAVDALESAWDAAPSVVAVALARPAYYLLRRGTRDLGGGPFDDGPPNASDARRAYASFYRAARYAEAVPPTVTDLRRVLDAVAD